MNEKAIFGKTAEKLHEKVLGIMKNEKVGRLLEAPAGEGELSFLFKENGFEVFAADINDKIFKPRGIQFDKVDLNAALPYQNAFFHYILCVEGIEHLENPHHLLREFRRVTVIGGKIIFTTPNIMNIFSRLRFLLIGHHEYFGDYFSNPDNFGVMHINPVGFAELAFCLKENGFEIEEISYNRNVLFAKGILLGIFMFFLLICINMVTKLKVKDKIIRKLFLSKELLLGQILILKCRKTG